MRKFLSILALALCFVACQNEPVETVTNADLVDVTLCLEAPELSATRADGDGINGRNSALGGIDFMTDADWANYDIRYILEVYAEDDVDGTNGPIYLQRMVNCLDKYAPTTFALRLVPGRSYKFVVFADFVAEGNAAITEPADRLNISDLYYNTADLRNISAIRNQPTWNAMNEIRDAYFVSEVVAIDGLGLTKNLTLTRPFAKLRVITTDLDYISAYATPARVKVTYTSDVYNSFNAVSGELNATTMTGSELVYDYAVGKTIPYSDGYDASSTNQTLFSDFLFAREGQQSPVTFDMEVYDANGMLLKATEFNTQIPVQRNHLTTVIGDLLTTQTNIVIDINDDFVDEFVIGAGDGNDVIVNTWGAGVLGANGYEFTLTSGSEEFLLTIGANAVENNELKAGNYVLAEDAEEGDLTFSVEQLKAEATRAMVDVEVIGGMMTVAKAEGKYTIALQLVLDYGNNDVRQAHYKYEGPITFGETLDAPAVTVAVEGNVATLTWEAVENATSYTVNINNEMPVVTEETTYVFTGEYETTYSYSVVAVNDELVSVPFNGEFTTGAAPVVETYNIYFNNIAEWAAVYAHIWANEGEDLGLDASEWPGRKLEQTETIDGVTYYVFNLPAEATGKTVNVVFNDGAGTQTKDLSGVATENLFFDNYVEPIAPSEVVLYLEPNANWNIDGARFAAYFFGNGETWVDMTLVEGETNIYAVTVPAGFENIIFCRMNPNAAANNWNNKWNQTADLKVPTDGNNLYTVEENSWDKGNGVWSVYAPAVVEPTEPTVLATPVVSATVEGNVITLAWETIENAAQYGITVGTEMPVFVEETNYVFTGEYETEYTFNVVAVPADEVTYAVSEAAVVTATTEAAPAEEVVYTTVAEFLAAEENDTTMYTLRGTITAVANTSYGNFDLTDETGTVYIYGLMSEDGATNKYWAASGAKLGDDIVIKTIRTSFNGTPQGKNAWFVELVSPGTLPFWAFSKTATTFTAAGGQEVITVDAYNLTENISVSSDNTHFTATYADGALTITAAENTTTDAINGNITVTAGALVQVITVAQGGVSVGGGTEVIAEATMKNFGWANAAGVSEAQIDDNVTVKFFQGGASTAPAYYTSGEAVRLYQNGAYMTVSANGKTIKSMEITFANNMYYVAADSGELTEEAATRTWTGDATEVKITCTGTDKNHRAYIKAIKVTYVD